MINTSVPLPPYGFRVDIVSLPETWLRLSDRSQWDQTIKKTLERIGLVCQTHIRNIMAGREPRRDGQLVQFIEQTGRGRESIQWEVNGNSVDIFADERTKTPGGTSYLVYQEYGVATQKMSWLIGKTIPWKVIAGGQRVNPRTGTVVQGVTRVKFAGRGSRYWGDKDTQFSTITEATFTKPSKYNPTGYKYWHPGFKGRGFWQSGILNGLEEVASHIQGIAFRAAGGGPEPVLGTDLTGPDTHFTAEYQQLLDDLEQTMQEQKVFPFNT